MTIRLTIEASGVSSILVDEGRSGYQRMGISVGGPMDHFAFQVANKLCSNAPGSAAIEITSGGFECTTSSAVTVAITGADMPVAVNGREVLNGRWKTLNLNPGDRLSLAQSERGLRSYLAFAANLVCESDFGSVTSVRRDKLGGLQGDGQGLQQGDQLILRPRPCQPASWPKQHIPEYPEHLEAQVVSAYQEALFDGVQTRLFYAQTYTVTQQIDRMGMRLAGQPIHCEVSGITSEGMCLGAVQITGSGQAIVMMSDRQTLGGYPKIGTVHSLDCNRLAQLKPGDRLSFSQIDAFTAHNRLLLHKQWFEGITLE